MPRLISTVVDVSFIFEKEVIEAAGHRVRGSLAKSAQRRLDHRIGCCTHDIQIMRLPFPGTDLFEAVEEHARSNPAGRALAARLMLEEMDGLVDDPVHAV